jgi:CheY-like chemotaxis protein
MDVSRISTGKIELKRERTTLRHVLDSAIEIAEPLAKAKWQEILVTVPSDRVVLDADPARLAQLFSNLLNNAIKYSPAGKLVHVTARRMHDEIIVSVEDQGIGISSESLAQVFEPFLQINRSHEGGEPGLGIGLTLVKRLAELHGGSVSAHSEGVNKGSTFVVRLPVLANEPTAGADDAAPSLKSGHRRILIVDDNRDAAESLGRLLELLGHEIHYAHDGVRALETVGEVHPEVVLLDIGLPGLDGYGVCRGIREKEGEPRPFVVAVTGWGQEKDRQRSFDAGFDAHLVKPVEIGKLTELLAEGSGPKKPVESVE